MKRWLMLAVLVFFAFHAKAETDTTKHKQHYVYIIPFPVPNNDVLELNDYWLVAGFDRLTENQNRKVITGISIGTIVFSKPSTGVFISVGLNATRSIGLRINLERKYLLTKRFYVSGNLFGQATRSFCNETINSTDPYINEYEVNRLAVSLIPKAGWILNAKLKPFYFDLNFGMGLKYITSQTHNKIGPLSNQLESYSAKKFESGSKFTYHPLAHVKVGIQF